jgi:hypothetical protein
LEVCERENALCRTVRAQEKNRGRPDLCRRRRRLLPAGRMRQDDEQCERDAAESVSWADLCRQGFLV